MYGYLFRDSSFTDRLMAHIEDASISSLIKSILNDNLDIIKDGLDDAATKYALFSLEPSGKTSMTFEASSSLK